MRAGSFDPEPLSLTGGLIGGTGGTEIDVAGHLVLPGIVDLRSSAWRAHLPSRPKPADVAGAVADGLASLARHGITTAWISAGWTRADACATPAMAEAVIAAIAGRGPSPVDIAARIEADTHLTDTTDRLIAVLRAGGIAHLSLVPLLALLIDIADQGPAARAAHARALGVPVRNLDAAIAEAQAAAPCVTRNVCRLAETCDAAGIGYSSTADKDAEEREYYRMIGARMADAPRTRSAAAAAAGMGDPVLLDAAQVIDSARHQSWVADGLIDALVSGNSPSSVLRAVLALQARDLMPLETAWALVSARPAAIMGLTDRGEIEPGRRADLVIVEAATGHVAATLSAGRVTAGHGSVARALAQAAGGRLAAE
ncbi:amidohydrolase family protein [Rhodobacterales bacterium HKCCE3408]|nr:amidohydrolase family protein [Rhodobacterales bacterium HKCCE3408]